MPGITGWRARLYDACEGSMLRRARHKRNLFREMTGSTLFLAVGTGTDIRYFPPDLDITAIDISDEMLRRAAPRAMQYPGRLQLMKADALDLPFADDSFDTAATSCTMCSVPDPLRALRELHRVLRPGGRLLMFEHVRSRSRILGRVLDIMTLYTRLGGTEMNRDTVPHVTAAGFHIQRIESAYLDIILAIRAVKEPSNGKSAESHRRSSPSMSAGADSTKGVKKKTGDQKCHTPGKC
jgi:ubiquinone/menaquinone biosynthesis C-methylase UbiE